MKNLLILAGFFGASAVILGALGAHALGNVLEPKLLASFKTGVLYHLVHSFIFLGLIALKPHLTNRAIKVLTWQFSIGIILFSWSIYCLSTASLHELPISFLGPITPIGGLILISGWLHLLIRGIKFRENG